MYIWKSDNYQIKEDIRNDASRDIRCNEEISEAIPKEARSPRVCTYLQIAFFYSSMTKE